MTEHFDEVLTRIADYVLDDQALSEEAYNTARYCLMDAVGCGLLALNYPACTRILGPLVPEAGLPGGARVWGTNYELDPVQAAFNLGTLIRWLDYNDTWLAAEWGHPSDNLGGILAVADYLSRQASAQGQNPLTLKTILTALIKAYEIQGILALENSFNRVGLDHVLLVRVASTAVVTHLLGGTRQHILNALSHAWVDGGALRTYRHAPNTGSRKSWAAGDATSRAVRLAYLALRGEMGYPSALSANTWGFCDALMRGQPIRLGRKLGSYVMENILFKIAFPAEFHAQTACEAAIQLHPFVNNRWDQIEKIIIETQESALRIIDKQGPLHNPADRDHCIQYIVAVGLLKGQLTAEDYEDQFAKHPLLDQLRDKMKVVENPEFTRDYLDPNKRSIGNSVQIFFHTGESSPKITLDYPIGHRRRRPEGIPLLWDKFKHNAETRLPTQTVETLLKWGTQQRELEQLSVTQFMTLLCAQ